MDSVSVSETGRADRVIRTGQRMVARGTIIVAVASSLGILIMILMGTIDTLGTKLLDSPLSATVEATEALMVVLLFGGLAYAQLEGRHIRVELLIKRLPKKWQDILVLIGNVFGVVFFGLLTYYAVLLFWHSWLMRESAPSIVRFPIYPAKFFMIIGATMMTLQLAIDVIVEARNIFLQGSSAD